MKQIIARSLLILIFLSDTLSLAFTGKRTTFIPRSQSTNAERSLVGWYDSINNYHKEPTLYWHWSLCGEYSRTSSSRQIEDFLFGRKQFSVAGSRVAGRASDALLADYFGLPQDYQGVICFAPTISTFTADFEWFWRIDHVIKGWYFRAHAPVVHTTWDLNTEEKISVPGSLGYPAGYMGPAAVANSALPKSLKEVMDNTLFAVTFGDMQSPIAYGRVYEDKVHTHISDVQLETGYDFYNSKKAHIGFGIRVAIPSGTRPEASTIFSPIIGNGHHWEFGLANHFHIIPWMNVEQTSYFGIYSDLYIMHMLKDTQPRSYDFLNQKAGSRYILIERFFNTDTSGVFVNGTQITTQYQGQLLPAINATTLCSTVSFPLQVDWALMFAYHRGSGLDINWGYGLWFRAEEKLHKRDCFPNNTYALKGDAQIYGFDSSNNPYKLSVTQYGATIFGGQNGGNFVTELYANTNADMPVNNVKNSTAQILQQLNGADSTSFSIPQVAVYTSSPSIILSDSDINNDSALMPQSLSHKLFINIGLVS